MLIIRGRTPSIVRAISVGHQRFEFTNTGAKLISGIVVIVIGGVSNRGCRCTIRVVVRNYAMGNGGNLAKAFILLFLAAGETIGRFPFVVSATCGGLIILPLLEKGLALFGRHGTPLFRWKATVVGGGGNSGDSAR